jgi:uncharacterized protein YbaR (Trm112 family)
MSACPNCKSQLSCGCQRRTASNGTTVCSGCLAAYESKLQGIKPTVVKKDLTRQPIKEKAKATTPPQLNVWGKDRYKNLHKFIKK